MCCDPGAVDLLVAAGDASSTLQHAAPPRPPLSPSLSLSHTLSVSSPQPIQSAWWQLFETQAASKLSHGLFRQRGWTQLSTWPRPGFCAPRTGRSCAGFEADKIDD